MSEQAPARRPRPEATARDRLLAEIAQLDSISAQASASAAAAPAAAAAVAAPESTVVGPLTVLVTEREAPKASGVDSAPRLEAVFLDDILPSTPDPTLDAALATALRLAASLRAGRPVPPATKALQDPTAASSVTVTDAAPVAIEAGAPRAASAGSGPVPSSAPRPLPGPLPGPLQAPEPASVLPDSASGGLESSDERLPPGPETENPLPGLSQAEPSPGVVKPPFSQAEQAAPALVLLAPSRPRPAVGASLARPQRPDDVALPPAVPQPMLTLPTEMPSGPAEETEMSARSGATATVVPIPALPAVAPSVAPPVPGAIDAVPDQASPAPETRGPAAPPHAEPHPAAPHLRAAWADLAQVALDEAALDRALVISAARRDPAYGAFDVLRTRLLDALAERGWSRVGITSPTKGCGKSLTAMNLAVALSRYDGRRTILMDMDMRMPSLARSLAVTSPGSLGDVLRGLTPAAAHLQRVAPNRLHIGHLALGLNSQPEAFAAELFQEPRTAEVLAGIQAQYRPDVTLFDLPPALAQDDVIAFRQHFDCILMVVGGGMTSAREVRESIRRLGEDKPVVGIVLNRAEGEGIGEYAY